jgi:hypothetical protein
VFFADADYFITDFPASTCKTCINPLFAWNHGDIQPEIANTWLGFVGPGVERSGQDHRTWSDHADVRPTILSLVGLRDSYVHDGRALVEIFDDHALPRSLRDRTASLSELGAVYKQLNAPFGRLALDSLVVSTAALTSAAPGDAVYTALQGKLASWVERRDSLAGEMKALLDAATFQGDRIESRRARGLIVDALALMFDVGRCAASPAHCAK